MKANSIPAGKEMTREQLTIYNSMVNNSIPLRAEMNISVDFLSSCPNI